jgi:CheY-like chemotaxis protein
LGEVEVEGLGLGLALAERIARLLGGTIEVSSQPARGSRFSLVLPALAGRQRDASQPPVAHPTDSKPCSLDVLVVDNDPRIVEASIELLSRIGHRPRGASTPVEALSLRGPIDAALVDYQLDAGTEGLTLIEELRRHRPGLRAALVTAEATPAIRRRAAALGVDVYAKPVSARVLEEFLNRVSG